MLVKSESVESSALIDIMPTINQNWTTYTNSINGWTIPVGGEIILIKLNPETEETKRIVRSHLSKVKLHLEYTDIYLTKFTDEASLAFFGGHLK